MGKLENQWRDGMTRRKALASLAGVMAGSPLLRAQLDLHGALTGHRRMPGLTEMTTVFDFQPVFHANLPQLTADFTYHGDGSEFTLRRNRQAFDWVEIVQGRAVAPQSVNLSTELLGLKLQYPVMVAPTSVQVPLHPDGEVGMYRAATATKTPMIVSNNSSLPLEKIAASSNEGSLWFQFYPRQDLDASRQFLDRAQSAGYKAIVVTVDQQASFYPRSLQNRNLGGNPRPPAGRGAGAGGQAAPVNPNPYRFGYGRMWYTWEYLDEIRKFIKVPMLIKGILTAEDAELCVQRGMDGIIVSNHGGRSLDYGPSTFEVLPEISAAVKGRIPILVDSGFRRGSDVFKALALGANAVCFGRATRFGLGAFGAPGVQRVLEIVQAELVQAAASAGRSSLAAIDKTAVRINLP